MKIISKIKIHPFFYIVMLICLFTGNIHDFLVLTSIIIVHEIGHIILGLSFKWKLEKVVILPFGGLSVFNNKINTPLIEQFFVAIAGPIFQMIFYFFISLFYISKRVMILNYLLLFFNLIPIYPLDGSKILYVFLNIFFSFKHSHLILIFVSMSLIFLILITNDFNFILLLALFFLCFNSIKQLLNHKSVFNKFLFERYIYDLNFKKVKKVKGIHNMRIWCRHIFVFDNSYITEKKMLSKRFDK